MLYSSSEIGRATTVVWEAAGLVRRNSKLTPAAAKATTAR
jgi:hypothetical protein